MPPIRKWLSSALDLIYPPRCAVCGSCLTAARSLCQPCDSQLPRLATPFCKQCGEPFPGDIEGTFACPNCSKIKFAFEFARPAMIRDVHTLEMIHRLKYNREVHLADELGRLAAEAFEDPRLADALAGKWPVIPVPLHRRRLQHRHFNQAEEIALALSHRIGLPVLKALRRNRPTETQTALSRAQRMENLRGAFSATSAGLRQVQSSPAGAIVFDDVLTTGSTVGECAKVLRRAGFKRVQVVTVMRG